MLRIATLNIRNTTDRYDERCELMMEEIKKINADILGLQEVCWNQIPLLYNGFGNTGIICQSPCRDPILSRTKHDYRVDGDMLLIKNNGNVNKIVVESQEVLVLSFERVVQKVILSIRTTTKRYRVCVANTHLHDGISREDILERERQCEVMIEWLHRDNYDGYVVMGDFNADHNDIIYHYMENSGYTSGYKSIHGSEPERTFPSGIQAPTMDIGPEFGCIDYIWFKGCIHPRNSSLWANNSSPSDDTIYPSDHYGIYLDIDLS